MDMMSEAYRKTCVKIVGLLSLCIFIYAAFNLGKYYLDYRQQVKSIEKADRLWNQGLGEDGASSVASNHSGAGEQEMDIFQQTTKESEQLSKAYKTMKQQNNDYVFWLNIADTEMDFPVVQRDNDYYLEHNFYGQHNSHGAVFLDERFDAAGDVLLVHGHHMKDGTMFAGLKNYKNADWRKAHLEAELYLEQEQRSYRLFAGVCIDLLDEDSFRYEELPADAEAWEAYLKELQSGAFWFESPEYEDGDRILILSTCDYGTEDERLVLYGIDSAVQ